MLNRVNTALIFQDDTGNPPCVVFNNLSDAVKAATALDVTLHLGEFASPGTYKILPCGKAFFKAAPDPAISPVGVESTEVLGHNKRLISSKSARLWWSGVETPAADKGKDDAYLNCKEEIVSLMQLENLVALWADLALYGGVGDDSDILDRVVESIRQVGTSDPELVYNYAKTILTISETIGGRWQAFDAKYDYDLDEAFLSFRANGLNFFVQFFRGKPAKANWSCDKSRADPKNVDDLLALVSLVKGNNP